MFNFAQARTNMIDSQIQTSGVVDEAILQAFDAVARELFIPEKYQNIAYYDGVIDLGQGRHLIAPLVYARILQAANIKPSDTVLDVAGGTGYCAAVLSLLAARVVSIECNKRQIEKAGKLWARLGLENIESFEGLPQDGCAVHAPYDVIIFNGALPQMPEKFHAHLNAGGRMLAIIQQPESAMGRVVIQYCDNHKNISTLDLFDAAAPQLSGFEQKPAFHF